MGRTGSWRKERSGEKGGPEVLSGLELVGGCGTDYYILGEVKSEQERKCWRAGPTTTHTHCGGGRGGNKESRLLIEGGVNVHPLPGIGAVAG